MPAAIRITRIQSRIYWRRVIVAVLISASTMFGTGTKARADEAVIATGQQTNGKARTDILSLRRTEGETLTLRFAVANGNSRTLSIVLGNLRLIDLVNRRSYEPGVKSPDCNVPNGERRVCWPSSLPRARMFGPSMSRSMKISVSSPFPSPIDLSGR